MYNINYDKDIPKRMNFLVHIILFYCIAYNVYLKKKKT